MKEWKFVNNEWQLRDGDKILATYDPSKLTLGYKEESYYGFKSIHEASDWIKEFEQPTIKFEMESFL